MLELGDFSKGNTMQKVNGFGGFFFRAKDPAALTQWYNDTLGVSHAPTDMETPPWVTDAGVTVFSPFGADTDYFAEDKTFMLNFRVADLDAGKAPHPVHFHFVAHLHSVSTKLLPSHPDPRRESPT